MCKVYPEIRDPLWFIEEDISLNKHRQAPSSPKNLIFRLY